MYKYSAHHSHTCPINFRYVPAFLLGAVLRLAAVAVVAALPVLFVGWWLCWF